MPKLAPPGRNVGNCQPGSWTFHELPNSDQRTTCLDGSPYGFYYMAAVPNPRREPPSMRNNDSWLLNFEGGGWCFSPEDCAVRSEGRAGSSLHWEKSAISIGGVVNKCCFCTRFCRFHRVYLKSCDGHAFGGDAEFQVPPSSHWPLSRRPQQGESEAAASAVTLRSNGRAILRAVINVLVDRFGMREARHVLVAGCSAGGMAALLNAERIRAQLLALGVRPARFKVASIAGVFFNVPAPSSALSVAQSLVSPNQITNYLSPFEEQTRAMVTLGNVELPERCRSFAPVGSEWRCLLGLGLVEALPEDLPAFIFQSRLDLWQTNCIFAAGRSRYFGLNCSQSTPAWHRCLGWMQPLKAGGRCTPDQWAALRAYEESNGRALASSAALRRDGYGSFTHSCFDHCATTAGLIYTGASLLPGLVNDSVNLRESLFSWFLGGAPWPPRERDSSIVPPLVPAWNHTHMGCWNSPVSIMVPGKANEPGCRKPECGLPDKMHKDNTAAQRQRIRSRGWKWQLDE